MEFPGIGNSMVQSKYWGLVSKQEAGFANVVDAINAPSYISNQKEIFDDVKKTVKEQATKS
ncbi:MAG: hypothetical protein ISR65_19750 [Bacteriovoracaceae bacterium]|nr:hypothetical protein [Bacteriovoracaceae bacterium]